MSFFTYTIVISLYFFSRIICFGYYTDELRTYLFDRMIVDAKTNERSALFSFLQKFSMCRKHPI